MKPLALAALAAALAAAPFAPSGPSLAPDDRVLVLAPHPDDEVLGAGGIIARAAALRLPVRVVFLTNGDENEMSFLFYRRHPVLGPGAARRMGIVRRDEALKAAASLGVPPERVIFLGYPDRGTLKIWSSHWGTAAPFFSLLTEARAVPYRRALRPGAPYKGEEILRDLEDVLREFKPTKIFLPHLADHHPDHQALGLFARVAAWELGLRAELLPYLVHYKRWPRPKGYHPGLALEPPAPLRQEARWIAWPLSPAEVESKLRALREHRSQYGYSARRLLALLRSNELFGDFPETRLAEAAEGRTLHSEAGAEASESGEGLGADAKTAFVGVERKSAAVEGGKLVLSVLYAKPLSEDASISIYAFGYRSKIPFAGMPKLRARFSMFGHAFFDGGRRLGKDAAQVERGPCRIVVKIPLELLGSPEKVLTSTQSSFLDIPLQRTAWRILDLTGP